MRVSHLSVLLLALLISIPLVGQSSSDESSGWKAYENAHYNFAFRYPADGWSRYEGFDRNGALLTPRDKDKFRLRPEIGAGGTVGQPSDNDETRSRNLDEDFQFGLEAIKEGGHGRNLIVLSKVTMKVQGLPAIENTFRYEESPTGHIWFNKEILIHSDGDSPTYHLSLRCSPDDAPVLVPLFDKISKTFRILGPPA
jgi:hypothetical protein